MTSFLPVSLNQLRNGSYFCWLSGRWGDLSALASRRNWASLGPTGLICLLKGFFFFFFCIFWLLLGSCALWYNFMIRTSFTMVLASLITELLSPAPSPAHHHPQESPPVPESIVQTLPEICQPWSCDTSALGSQFQCANILWVKNLSNLNLPWHYVRPFPQILSLGTSEEISVFPYDVLLKLFSSISHPFKLIKF